MKPYLAIVKVGFLYGAYSIDVDYLKTATRFHTKLVDHYFSCKCVGQTLQWEVNNIRLGGFESGSTKTWTSSKNGVNYTAALLSSNATTNQQTSFNSVLILSVTNTSRLDVICRSESEQNTTSNEEYPLVDQLKLSVNNSQNIHLEYIMTSRILLEGDLLTSIFICGVENVYQTWKVKDHRYGFDTTSKVGQDRIQSRNIAIVDELAILIARQPYQVVTILFVTDTSNITVICASGEEEEKFSVPVARGSEATTIQVSNLSTPSNNEYTQRESMSAPFPDWTTETNSSPQNEITIIALTTTSVALLFTLTLAVIVTYLWKVCRKKHETNLCNDTHM